MSHSNQTSQAEDFTSPLPQKTQPAAEPPSLCNLKLPWLLLLSFALPFVICCIVYVTKGYYPFGDKSLLVVDLWQQYFPMIREFRETLLEGGSLLWTWHSGLGSNAVAMLAYYYASPLNLLTVLVPEEHLSVFLSLLIFARIGLCGLTAALFLSKVFHRRDLSVVFFASLWAMSAYFIGYSWNLMWLESIALMPVILLGAIRLIRDKRPLCYTVSLALCVFLNYYMGYFICVAVLFSAVCITVLTWQGMRAALRSFARMLFHSIIAIGAAAVLLLPSVFALGNTYSIGTETVDANPWNGSLLHFVSVLFPLQEPNLVTYSHPNLGCGLICILLFFVFLTGKRRIREKVCVCGGLAFLMLSFLSRAMDFLWNGGHNANGIPFRYSFLFSFLLVAAAYRAFCDLRNTRSSQVFLAAAITEVIALLGYQHNYISFRAALVSTLATVLYAFLFMMYENKPGRVRTLTAVLCMLICTETVTAGAFGIKNYFSHSHLFSNAESISSLLDTMEDDTFTRTEMTTLDTPNAPLFYGYNGFSQFSSLANGGVITLFEQLGAGAYGGGNRYIYYQSTPLINSITAIKHLISKNGTNFRDVTLQEVARQDEIAMYEYAYPLPVAFPVEGAPHDGAPMDSENPFANQNTLFTQMTGLVDVLFEESTKIEATATGGSLTGSDGNYTYSIDENSNGVMITFTVTCLKDGMYYYFPKITDALQSSLKYGDIAYPVPSKYYQPAILPAGYYKAGETFELRCTVNRSDKVNPTINNALLQCAVIDLELFEEGYEILSDGALIEESHTDTSIVGTVSAEKDCVLYTSIPYEKGWSIYLDGEKVKTKAYADAFVSCDLPAGEHRVELRYLPEGLIPGAVISVLCILLIVASALFYRRKVK